jgi:RHS repeat-associated protein
VQGGVSTVYIFSGEKDIAEYDNGSGPASPAREFVYSASQLIATLAGTQVTYDHADHLSIRVNTDGTAGSPTYGQVIGEQGHYPFGEPWYTANTTSKFFFTTYEHDDAAGLDYAMARYYDNSMGRFCSVDPLEGFVEDPQSWNRYAYSRNNPVNLTDPSGKGFWGWLIDIFIAIIDILTFGATSGPTLALQGGIEAGTQAPIFIPLLPPMIFDQGLPTLGFTQKAQPSVPKGYTPCPGRWFLITGVGPIGNGQGVQHGAAGVEPQVGDVAYNPNNYGLSNAQAKALDRSDHPLLFKPDWSSTQIPRGRNNTGTMAPAPDKGYPKIPDGLPVSQDDTLTGRDTIGGVNRAANRNRIDLYRYGTQGQADRATRRVKVVVMIPIKVHAKCPR